MEEALLTANRTICPKCGLEDKSIKVSAIYIEALQNFRSKGVSPLLAQIMTDPTQLNAPGILKTQALRALVRSFGPPSGGRQIIRPINPNLVVAAFTLISIFFVVQIYISQRELFVPILVLVAAFYLGYAVFRNRIQARYQKRIQENLDIKSSYEAAIGLWMRLYYCSRDEIVFNPEENRWMPLEAMEAYLLDQKTA